MHPKSHKEPVGLRNILHRITCPLTPWPFIFIIVQFCLTEPPLLFFFSLGIHNSFCFPVLSDSPCLIIFRSSLCLLLLLSRCFPSLLPAFFSPPLPSPPPLSLSFSFLSTGLMFCSLLLVAMCSSSQLVFPLICSSFISGRHTCPGEGVGRAAVGQLMLSAGGDFTTEFRGPVWPEEGRTGRVRYGNVQCEPHCPF